jgi:ParB-like chromosome segregation protein Spo0J
VIWVDIKLIEEPRYLLREVDTEDPKFVTLVESMRKDGFWESSPIEVIEDRTGQSLVYVIASGGMHRLKAAQILRLVKVPVVVLDKQLTEGELLVRAMVAEASHVEARPFEYGKALKVIQGQDENRGITVVDLAIMVRKDEAFVRKCLKLQDLPKDVGDLVDDGKVSVGAAMVLATLTKEGIALDQKLVEKAKFESVEALQSEATKLIEEKRKGPKRRKEPAPKLRPLADVQAELERATKDPSKSSGYVQALAWVLRKDAVSAAVEGGDAARLGTAEEGPALRAEAAQLEDALARKDVEIRGLEDTVQSLKDRIEKLNMEIESKDAIIDSYRKNRKGKDE